jgi:hypothetical protein
MHNSKENEASKARFGSALTSCWPQHMLETAQIQHHRLHLAPTKTAQWDNHKHNLQIK